MKEVGLWSKLVPIFFTIAILISGCSAPSQSDKSAERQKLLRQEEENDTVEVSIDQAQANEIGLQTANVRQGYIYKTVDAPGRVVPNAELCRLVSTPSAGRVIEVRAKLGDFVRPGQVMAVIKSDPIGQIQSDLLQNSLQAKADIKQQEVQLKLSHITYERELKLFNDQVSAKADLQAAENQLEKDTANLAALKSKLDSLITTAQERLKLLGAPPDSAKRVVETKQIDPLVVVKAIEGGLVIERNINPGEIADGTKQLFTLADLSQVWLFADVFEKDVHEVKKGQEAIVSIDDLPEKPFPARIIWVGDSLNATTRTLPVRANVNNANGLLKPGMFARIKISIGKVPVVLVPRLAVIQKGDKTLVFVDKGDGLYQEKEVDIGDNDANDIEIKSGLAIGDSVVTNGSTALLGTAMKTAEGKGD